MVVTVESAMNNIKTENEVTNQLHLYNFSIVVINVDFTLRPPTCKDKVVL